MEFAKYYKATSLMRDLVQKNELFAYGEFIHEVYVCMDVRDFWVARVQKDIDSEYEKSPGTWLVELEKISREDILDYIEENHPTKNTNNIFDRASETKFLIQCVLKKDEEKGLENWELHEEDSLEDIERRLDGGYGFA